MSADNRRVGRLTTWILLVLFVTAGVALAQTKVKPPKNKYTAAQDVELGQQAAAEAERQLPILRDAEVTSYLERLGRRLVDSVAPEYQHREFRYYFKVVDARDINAFALPGGPMYVTRGMIEAASAEAEVAGVMAHELSHVVLRHGTAQATKAQKYQLGALAGAIAGAIIGGNVGDIVAQGSQFGIGAVFLKFSREYEKEADLLGSQIMARAGYDPRAMARMFETIERQGGRGGPQWLSSHPNPGNRVQYIAKEAESLRVVNPVRNTRDFDRVQARLRGMQPARSMEEIARSGPRDRSDRRNDRYPEDSRIGGRVEPPSSRYRTYREGDLFRVAVPENWRELAGSNSVTFAPEGAYGQIQGQSVFTHGVQLGITRNETHNLRDATDELIGALAQSNPRLRRQSGYQRGDIDGREGLASTLSNVSEVTGRPEVVALFTTLLSDGNLFFIIGVAPQDEYRFYQGAFQRVVRSVQLEDRYARRRY